MIWLLWLPVTLGAPRIFPLVDPGLFVISGVKTCGDGSGYCLLGLDCTLDEDFLPDEAAGHHCEGLRSAFTPSAHFVCCRASNRSVYKPPIIFPQVINTTTSVEPVTSRTTTLNVLENEIDQVLLKVAQSVDAVKKSPTTETSQTQTDSVELRESVEQQVSTEEEEEMLADSPEMEDLGENEYEDSSQDSSMEEDSDVEVSTLNQPPPVITTMAGSEEYELSTDSNNVTKSTDSSTSTNMLDSLTTPSKPDSSENAVIPIKPYEKPKYDEDILNKTVVDKENPNEGPDKVTGENTLEVINTQNGTNSQEHSVDGAASRETPIQNDIPIPKPGKETENKDLDVDDTDNKNLTTVTPSPEVPLYTDKTPVETSKEPEQLGSKTTSKPLSKKPPENKDNSNKFAPNIEDNEVMKSPAQSKDKDNNLLNSIKPEKTPPDDPIKIDPTEPNPLQTKNPTVTQEGTNTTVSPTTKSPVNGQPSTPGVGDQGQPEVARPCSRAASANCSQEVKFVFQNQTLCFGSTFTVDWIVTSASCALRIFRAGMVNVSVFPSTGPQKGEVKTIVVHESYGEGAGSTGQEMESNNIGLVQLRTSVALCLPCLPTPDQDLRGANCSATTNLPVPTNCTANGERVCKEGSRAIHTGSICVGLARQIVDDYGLSYITLSCDTPWEPRFTDSMGRGSGSPLFCDGLLAGIEASKGVGLLVYTPLTRYIPWLQHNTSPPDQHFNTG